MNRYILLTIVAAFTLSVAYAEQSVAEVAASKADTTVTKTSFLPTSRRIDRQIDRNKFVFKGEVMLGLTASHGRLNVEDSDLMLLLDNIDLGLNSTTVKPFLAYAYRDNRAVGMRFGYEYLRGDLGNVALNLGSAADISFALGGVGLKNENYAWSIFHRNYIGLDRRGIIGAILESEVLVKTGSTSIFTTDAEGLPTSSTSRNFAAKINFNPGLAVYVFPEVCVTVTVGIGGLYYNNVRIMDEADRVVGRRDRTGLQFKFNIADIQIGVVAHLWNKKK